MATTVQVLGARQIVESMDRHVADMEQAASDELSAIAQLASNMMRNRAPKWRSHLVDTIDVYKPEPLVREIGPVMGYAEAVERGVKPGGKGLPRFADPASRDIVEWLENKAFSGRGRVRKNSMGEVMRNLELRDRYEGLAWHVRHKGVKAQPFVEPTHREMEKILPARMDLALRRFLASRPDADWVPA